MTPQKYTLGKNEPSKLNFIRFSIALLIGISGIKCLTRGVEILDQYYNDRSKI
jgi:hypothetical protein